MAGVVLAAGASRRMPGTHKLLRDWGGRSVLAAVVETAERAGLDPIVVVLGSEADALRDALGSCGGRAVELLPHPAWSDGRASSLRAGLGRLAGSSAPAAVVLLGDEPGIDAETIRLVVGAWRAGRVEAVRVRYSDRTGHPVLLARPCWPALDGGTDGGSTWDRLRDAAIPLLEVDVDRPAPIDVDAPADLAAARARRDEGRA